MTDKGWTTPRNLGFPINGPRSEKTLFIDTRGEYGYIVPEAPDKNGRGDIYEFLLWPELKPTVSATFVRGKVIDAKTNVPLVASVKLVDVESRDTVGTATYNLQLSQRRAESVQRFLIERGGIAAARITAKGYGSNRPVASNRTEERRALNRRTEIFFTGND